MKPLVASLAAALFIVSCARPAAADVPVRTAEPVQIAVRTVERFRELFDDDIGSVPGLMALDDAGTVEWGSWLTTARSRLGTLRSADLIGSEVVRTGATTSVELRYSTHFWKGGRVRELFVVRLDGTDAKIAFWVWWWS